MEALDIIEKRIETVSRILGPIPDSEIKGTENFVESLLSANTLISSAMSGRESISKIVDRSQELENYLDPNFIEQNQKLKSKEVYVSTVAPSLAETCHKLEQIKSLESTLGAEYFRNIPNDSDKLKNVAQTNSEFKQQSEMVEESLNLAVLRFGEMQNGFLKSLEQLNRRLNAIEEKLQKKKMDS